MTTNRPDIDLAALARPSSSDVPPPRRRWLWWLVPIVLVIGMLLVLFTTVLELFEKATPVTVIRPTPASASAVAKGAVVIQAAGWVEPDPFPISVTALADGVVAEMLVQEADTVTAGQPVARLVADDAELAVKGAEAALARAEAERAEAVYQAENAQLQYDAAIALIAKRDVAKATLAGRKAEKDRREAAAREQRAAVEVARRELDTQRYLRAEGAAGPWQVELAEARFEEAKAKLATLEADGARAVAAVGEAEARLKEASDNFDLRYAEKLVVETAVRGAHAAAARVDEVGVALAEARLRLDRMVVKAPAAGIVLTRDAQPGSSVGPGTAPVCQLYDPKSLRVRVDVQQTQLSGASVGLEADIRAESRRSRPYKGRVIRIVESADIQKVTVEVQIRVLDPDALLKPDMLCNVAVRGSGTDAGERRTAAVRIPARCLIGTDAVWVVDGETGRAARRTVETGARDGDDVLIVSGLNLTDKVIDSGAALLTEGARVEVGGER